MHFKCLTIRFGITTKKLQNIRSKIMEIHEKKKNQCQIEHTYGIFIDFHHVHITFVRKFGFICFVYF